MSVKVKGGLNAKSVLQRMQAGMPLIKHGPNMKHVFGIVPLNV